MNKSIVTKTGDKGETSLFERRISKSNVEIEACGAIDELNSFLGLVKVHSKDRKLKDTIIRLQKESFILGGVIAAQDKYEIKDEMLINIEKEIERIEDKIEIKNWALPGNNIVSANLDVSRVMCRKLERLVVKMKEENILNNEIMLKYTNRLSDLLWLLAREHESLI
jgi:cob(I)alamin adenosyltransferase